MLKNRMSALLKEYPLDLASVDLGQLDIFKDCYSLPAKPDDMYQLRLDVFEAYYSCVSAYGENIAGKMLLLCVKSLFEFIRVFSSIKIRQYCDECGFEPRFSRRNTTLNKIISGVDVFESTMSFASCCMDGPPFYDFVERLKRLAYGFRINRDIFYPVKTHYRGFSLLNTNPCILSCAFSKRLGRSFHYLSSDKFKNINVSLVSSPEKEFKDVAENVLKACIVVAKRYGVDISQEMEDSMSYILARHLSYAHANYLEMKRVFADSYGPSHLLGGTQASYFNRMIGLINMEFGGRTSAFTHGNEVGRIRDYRVENSFADDMVTYTNYAIADVKTSFKTYSHPMKRVCGVVSAETNYFVDSFEKQKMLSVPKKVKKVLLHCYCYDQIMNMDTVFPDIFYFNAEIRLISFLVSNGFEVLYKIHPETTISIPGYKIIYQEIERHFDGKVQILYDRLQEISHLADAFLMYYTTATSFYWLLCTQKPVIILDTDRFVRQHSDEALELMEKRCSFVQYGYDDKNMLIWDDAELLKALRQPKEPDFEIIKRYLFS